MLHKRRRKSKIKRNSSFSLDYNFSLYFFYTLILRFTEVKITQVQLNASTEVFSFMSAKMNLKDAQVKEIVKDAVTEMLKFHGKVE